MVFNDVWMVFIVFLIVFNDLSVVSQILYSRVLESFRFHFGFLYGFIEGFFRVSFRVSFRFSFRVSLRVSLGFGFL